MAKRSLLSRCPSYFESASPTSILYSTDEIHSARFTVLAAEWMWYQIFWNVMLHHWVFVSQHFEAAQWSQHIQNQIPTNTSHPTSTNT